jgi:hypothetical protein
LISRASEPPTMSLVETALATVLLAALALVGVALVVSHL